MQQWEPIHQPGPHWGLPVTGFFLCSAQSCCVKADADCLFKLTTLKKQTKKIAIRMHKNRSIHSIGKHIWTQTILDHSPHTVVGLAMASPAPGQTNGPLQLSNPQPRPSAWPLNFAH